MSERISGEDHESHYDLGMAYMEMGLYDEAIGEFQVASKGRPMEVKCLEMIALCFLERPIDFGALDGKPVHVMFSLVSPTVRAHLRLLSRLSFALHDPAFKKAVTGQASREEILREAQRVEGNLAHAATADGGKS